MRLTFADVLKSRSVRSTVFTCRQFTIVHIFLLSYQVMARTHLIEALFEWAWLMGMNLVKASKTPRPSIDDNWVGTKNRDFSIGLTAAKARIQAASAELSTTSADSNAERPVNHQTDNCGSYFMEARSNTMQTNLEALEKSSDSTDSDGDTTDNRENVEAGQIDLHNVLDSLNVKDKSSTRLNPGKQWPMAYQEEIQLHALDALTACGPLLLDDIIRLDGPNRLIAFLQWCDGSGKSSGTNGLSSCRQFIFACHTYEVNLMTLICP